jgi:hypothetical protein
MTEPFEFVSQFSMERNELMNYCKDAASNTDDYPIVEFSKTVNLAPDTSALQFIYDAPDNYSSIDFGSLISDTTKNGILGKMAVSSLNRKRMVKETIESVKFQVKEYKKTVKAPKF